MVVRCPSCGDLREMSAERYRKNMKAGGIPPCRVCMHPAKVKPPDETDYRFWLKYAGIELAHGQSARDWVLENGLPALLADIAEEMGCEVTAPRYFAPAA